MPVFDYEFLPAPLWLITVLHVLTLTLHFLAMNFLVGGVLYVLVVGRKRSEDTAARRFVGLFPAVMAATVTLGVAPLLFLQLVYFRQVYSASIVSAWFWLLIVGAAIAAYYLFYGAAGGRGRRGLLLLSLFGLLYISLVYSSVFSLAERPALVRGLYAAGQSGTQVHPAIGSWGVRWLHVILGAVAVGGFFAGILGRDDSRGSGPARTFFLGGMAGAMLLGLVYLFTLGDVILPFMRSPAVWVLTASVALSLGSLAFFWRRRWALSGLLLVLGVAGMVVVRHILRLLILEGSFDPASLPVRPQWSVFGLFLVFFLIALGLLAYMIRLLVPGRLRAG